MTHMQRGGAHKQTLLEACLQTSILVYYPYNQAYTLYILHIPMRVLHL